MMTGPDGRECCVLIRHKRIKLSGRRTSTFYLNNPVEREVERIEVDGCAVTSGPRCDWLIRTNDTFSREEIFVELKGSDISHAVIQIEAAIVKLSTDVARGSKRCFVALTRNPMAGTDVQKCQRKFWEKYHAHFLPVRDGSEHPL
jgi:hypothetical protein